MDDRYAYSRSFLGEKSRDAYARKFDNNVDQLRHLEEVSLIAPRAKGALFDCSIGTGRFVGQLPLVNTYSGMDYSPDFVDLVQHRFPDVKVWQGDLLMPLEQADASFDTVMCLRTLFALNDTRRIILEMRRIARPGGTLIFDYGAQARSSEGNASTSMDSVPRILAGLSLPYEEIKLDGLLYVAKKRPQLARLIHHSAKIRPVLRMWAALEAASLRLGLGDRRLYVVRC